MLTEELKAVLKDLKIGDKIVLDIVKEIDDKADAAVKIQKANEDLVKQREAWEAEKKQFKEKLAANETAIKDYDAKLKAIEAEKLSPEDRKRLAEANDLKALINSLQDEHKKLQESHQAEVKRREQAEEARKVAAKKACEESQRTKITNELAKHGITDSKSQQALYTLFGEGLVGLEMADDGSATEKYFAKNDKGELMTSSLSDLAKKFAETNPHLVNSSNRSGTGQNHQRATVPAGFRSLAEEKAEAERLFNGG